MPVVDLAAVVLLGECQSSCMVLGCEHWPWCYAHGVTHMHFNTPIEIIWQFSSLFKGADQSLLVLATARMDVPSWSSCTTCATLMECRCHLMMPGVRRTVAKSKTRDKSVSRDKKRGMAFGWLLLNHLFKCYYKAGAPTLLHIWVILVSYTLETQIYKGHISSLSHPHIWHSWKTLVLFVVSFEKLEKSLVHFFLLSNHCWELHVSSAGIMKKNRFLM